MLAPTDQVSSSEWDCMPASTKVSSPAFMKGVFSLGLSKGVSNPAPVYGVSSPAPMKMKIDSSPH